MVCSCLERGLSCHQRLTPILVDGPSKAKSRRRAMTNAIFLDPSQVRYTQENIFDKFTNNIPIKDTLHDILHGFLDADDLPPIRVWLHEGEWYSLDNRRLWVLRRAGVECILMENGMNRPTLYTEFSQKNRNSRQGLEVNIVPKYAGLCLGALSAALD
ncbi:hypothetical protein BC937DRAFT_94421 [Endogone sp. FLAS-F59071]|nr:hypothetical protein BC937DRAFT_94421 [Endogone sp. FLAS-F59071]|eukprot:RUS20773.1 hypothetical protein BC937DRAFT_94421 [Endogone sp. FLAS-F59071]